MDVLLIIIIVIVGLFGFVVVLGAPYVPTLKNNIAAAFELLKLSPGETLIEVGSGDGRMLLEAAKRGYNAVGYELNPILVLWSLWKTRRYRKQVRVVWGNALKRQWPDAQAVYVFGVAFMMPKLYKKITQEIDHSVKLVSFGFELPNVPQKAAKRAMRLYILND